MPINRKIIVTVKGDISYTDDLVYVYQDDRGIRFLFDVYDFKYLFDAENNFLKLYNITESSISIKNSNNELQYETQRNNLVDNYVLFEINHSMTDELLETGKYKLYLHLYNNKGGRITIPPIDFEIKRLSFQEDSQETFYNLADSEKYQLLDSEEKYIFVRG